MQHCKDCIHYDLCKYNFYKDACVAANDDAFIATDGGILLIFRRRVKMIDEEFEEMRADAHKWMQDTNRKLIENWCKNVSKGENYI
jgi:hypothetical protein